MFESSASSHFTSTQHPQPPPQRPTMLSRSKRSQAEFDKMIEAKVEQYFQFENWLAELGAKKSTEQLEANEGDWAQRLAAQLASPTTSVFEMDVASLWQLLKELKPVQQTVGYESQLHKRLLTPPESPPVERTLGCLTKRDAFFAEIGAHLGQLLRIPDPVEEPEEHAKYLANQEKQREWHVEWHKNYQQQEWIEEFMRRDFMA